MSFKISTDTTKLSWLIYSFGAAGVIARLFGVTPPKIINVSLDNVNLTSLHIAGILGIAVIFLTITFLCKVIIEYVEYHLAVLTEAMGELSNKEVVELAGKLPSDPRKEPLAIQISRETAFYQKIAAAFSNLIAILDVAFPLIFGAGAIALLIWPAFTFLLAVEAKIEGR